MFFCYSTLFFECSFRTALSNGPPISGCCGWWWTRVIILQSLRASFHRARVDRRFARTNWCRRESSLVKHRSHRFVHGRSSDRCPGCQQRPDIRFLLRRRCRCQSRRSICRRCSCTGRQTRSERKAGAEQDRQQRQSGKRQRRKRRKSNDRI